MDDFLLLTPIEAATRLRMSDKTFREHVNRGEIAWIAKGSGLKRPRKLFHPDDLDRFIASSRRYSPGPPTFPETVKGRRRAPSTTTISGSEVVGFMARLDREQREKLASPPRKSTRRDRAP